MLVVNELVVSETQCTTYLDGESRIFLFPALSGEKELEITTVAVCADPIGFRNVGNPVALRAQADYWFDRKEMLLESTILCNYTWVHFMLDWPQFVFEYWASVPVLESSSSVSPVHLGSSSLANELNSVLGFSLFTNKLDPTRFLPGELDSKNVAGW